jgi:hypothetical protein
LKFIKENGFPVRYQQVINVRATSDDEADQAGALVNHQTIRWIKRRPERSEAAEKFIRRLDELREKSVRQSAGKRWNERPRRVPATHQKDSTFLKLPENMPIDYFKPAFYNDLLPRLRYNIAKPVITFLPSDQVPFTGTEDERLSTVKFNRKYGADVLSRYQLVTEDDFADDEDDDEDDEMLYDEEPEEEPEDSEQEEPEGSEQEEVEVEEGMAIDEVEGNGEGSSQHVRIKKRRLQ